MKTTMMFQFLLLGSLFGQTSAIFPCRSRCQDVCENFVVGSKCWTNRGITNPSQCGDSFPSCRRGDLGVSCPQDAPDESSCRSISLRCNWCGLENSCYCNLWGCAVSKREIIIMYCDRLYEMHIHHPRRQKDT